MIILLNMTKQFYFIKKRRYKYFLQVFCSGVIKYAGQPVGIIVAKTHDLAIKAAKMVKIGYTNEKKPLLTVKEVLASGDTSRLLLAGSITPTKKNGTDKIKNN